MAIRIRVINGATVALCAARSMPKEGDIYLDDAVHEALSAKFAGDFNIAFDVDLPRNAANDEAIDQAESNNANRWAWDALYGGEDA